MGITAKARATTHLEGTTTLRPEEVIALIREGTDAKIDGARNILASGLLAIGASVTVVKESPSGLVLSLTSGKKLVELATFGVTASLDTTSNMTNVRVGGLETYKTTQQKFLFIIPVGPKQILGMSPYKKFLNVLAELIRSRDPQAQLVINQSNA